MERKILNNKDGVNLDEEDRRAQNVFGGLPVEKSSCCGAPVVLTKGGIRLRICSLCKNPIGQSN